MQKVNTPQGAVWMNITAAKNALEDQKSRPSLLAAKHASNPETKKGYDAAVNFYMGGTAPSLPTPKVEPTPTTIQPVKPSVEIDMSKFIPYSEDEASPVPRKRSNSLEVGPKTKSEWGFMNLLGGKKKQEEEAKQEEKKEEKVEVKSVQINTEGVADILKEMKEKKESVESEEESKEQTEEKEAQAEEVVPAPRVKDISDVDLMETLYSRLLRLKQVEAELEEAKRKQKEAEVTSEQLLIKLGREKEQVEDLKLQVKVLTQDNTSLAATVEKQTKIIHHLQQSQKGASTRLW